MRESLRRWLRGVDRPQRRRDLPAAHTEHPDLIMMACSSRRPTASRGGVAAQHAAVREIPILICSIHGRGNEHASWRWSITSPLPSIRIISATSTTPPWRQEEAVILLADDEEAHRRRLAGALREQGHQVVGRPMGWRRILLARRHRPDVAVLDTRMPRADGVVVLRALRSDEATAGVPVLMMAAVPRAAAPQNLGRVAAEPRVLSLDDWPRRSSARCATAPSPKPAPVPLHVLAPPPRSPCATAVRDSIMGDVPPTLTLLRRREG